MTREVFLGSYIIYRDLIAMITTGRIFDLVIILIVFGFTVYFIWRARRGRVSQLVKLPAVDAFEEGVGRAVEMGRPVHYTTAMVDIGQRTEWVEKVLGYYIMGYVAQMCASRRAQLYVSERDALTLGYVKETLRSAYERAGWPDGFNENMVLWHPWTTQPFALANWFQQVKPGANFMMGNLLFGTVIVAEAAALEGAFQIAYGDTPFLVATCEYVMIADEYYATSAYITKKPLLVGAITGNDYVKMLLLLVLIASVALLNLGIKDVLKWLAI